MKNSTTTRKLLVALAATGLTGALGVGVAVSSEAAATVASPVKPDARTGSTVPKVTLKLRRLNSGKIQVTAKTSGRLVIFRWKVGRKWSHKKATVTGGRASITIARGSKRVSVRVVNGKSLGPWVCASRRSDDSSEIEAMPTDDPVYVYEEADPNEWNVWTPDRQMTIWVNGKPFAVWALYFLPSPNSSSGLCNPGDRGYVSDGPPNLQGRDAICLEVRRERLAKIPHPRPGGPEYYVVNWYQTRFWQVTDAPWPSFPEVVPPAPLPADWKPDPSEKWGKMTIIPSTYVPR